MFFGLYVSPSSYTNGSDAATWNQTTDLLNAKALPAFQLLVHTVCLCTRYFAELLDKNNVSRSEFFLASRKSQRNTFKNDIFSECLIISPPLSAPHTEKYPDKHQIVLVLWLRLQHQLDAIPTQFPSADWTGRRKEHIASLRNFPQIQQKVF